MAVKTFVKLPRLVVSCVSLIEFISHFIKLSTLSSTSNIDAQPLLIMATKTHTGASDAVEGELSSSPVKMKMAEPSLASLKISPSLTFTGDNDNNNADDGEILYVEYKNEKDHLLPIMKLVEKDLSEPYSIFTYRYFVHQWPDLCLLAYVNGDNDDNDNDNQGQKEKKRILVGCVVCKIDTDDNIIAGQPLPSKSCCPKSGYIGMLAVDKRQRKKGIGTRLVCEVIRRMRDSHSCTSIMLETEVTNAGAMRLYERLGFIREELLKNYYLNWNDAYRLRLWLKEKDIPCN